MRCMGVVSPTGAKDIGEGKVKAYPRMSTFILDVENVEMLGVDSWTNSRHF